MRISLRQLEVFAAVARHNSVTQAADKIGLSQAAASQALAELEEALGQRLFDRHGRRVRLNRAGERLLPQAMQVLDRARAIEASDAQAGGSVIIGASLTVGNYLLPPLIARYVRGQPERHVSLRLANTEQIVDALLRFALDVGFIEGHTRHADLHAHGWREDKLVVVAHPEHPLAGRRATPRQLAQQAWVLREPGSGTREVFERAIEGHFTPQRTPLEFGGPEAIKRAVRTGMGLSCISRAVVAEDIAAKRLKPVHTPWMDLRRQLTLLIHRHKFFDSSLRSFLDVCGFNERMGSRGRNQKLV